MTVTALIVAAGRGRRLAAPTPKQYLALAGRPLLWHTVHAFIDHPRIDEVRVVIHQDDRSRYDQAVAGFDLLAPVIGGDSRQGSVLRGLESLEACPPDHVLIHDAARPFVPPDLIDRVLDALDQAPGAIPALAVNDTLKKGAGGHITGTLDRSGLWRAQTPQGFDFQAILVAHRATRGGQFTDDAAVAEAAGIEARLVAGDEENFKVTTRDDLERTERRFMAEAAEVRVATGIDVHGFCAGDHIRLCGIRIPFERGLAGHSDADVGLHAATDALFGALGEGDIGSHFPPGDERWAGADSAQFLATAGARVAVRGGRILHLDVTLVCERPKIAPHRPAMIARIAEILGISPARVSVKATTTEGLGFTGRGEGILVQAVASVALPPPDAPDDD